MPISRYPRIGHPISPSVLAPLLKSTAPKVGVLMSELDASCWERFGNAACIKLGRCIVEHLAPQIDDILHHFGSCRIAATGSDLKRSDLALEVRTYNCLGSINIDELAGGLEKITISEVMEIRAFGIKSLVDLLTSVEGFVGMGFTGTKPIHPTAKSQLNGICSQGICDVIRRSGFIPSSMADSHIPRPPHGLKLADLGLRVRTFNALKKAGYCRDPGRLGDLTLRQAIQIPSFGTESLCDLIEAIERVERVRFPLFAQRNLQRDETRVLLDLLADANRIPECVLESTIPPLPPGIVIEDLRLHCRTFKVLAREGFVNAPDRLSNSTIGELCKFRGFGDFCVVDLLESVCRIRESAEYAEPAAKSRFRDVEETLDTICAVPSLDNIGQADPRLGRLLRRIDASAASIAELAGRTRQLTILGRTDQLQKVVAELDRCRNLTVEDELIDIIVSKQASERNREIVADYYGFGGAPLVTLEVLGGRYKITRERIRQICAPSKIANLPAPPFAPALDAALELVRDSIPCFKSDLESVLNKQQVIRDGTTIDSLKRVANFLRRDVHFECIGSDASTFVLPTTQAEQLPKIEQTARKIVSKFGAAVMDDVLEQCDIALSDLKAKQLITAAVGSMAGFRWLDNATGWFWFESGFSRLRPRIRKVLSICESINVGELRAAIRRDYRLNGRVPSKRILLEICRQMPEVTVEGQKVVSVANDDPMELIRGDEAALVKLLQDHGPLCRMEELQKLAFGAGVSRASFWRCLQFCPTIARYGPRVYGLTGATIQPGIIESLAGVRRTSQVIQDHGWTDDGGIWIAYRISQGALESSVIGVPAAKREFIQGQFSLKAEHDGDIGQLTVKQTSAWGLGPYFRRRGVEVGDYLLLVFQLANRSALVTIGDKGLLERYLEAA